MNIKKQKVRPIMCTPYCDECGGLMVKNDLALATYPATYSYTCNKCGKTESSHTVYPYIDYKIIDYEKGE